MLQLRKSRQLRQRGDTIIEVMIVLAVLGLALSISYATANRSLLNTGQAEDNAQATRYVQSQIEALNELGKSGSYTCDSHNSKTNIFCQATKFCLPNAAVLNPIHHPTGAQLNDCSQGSQPYQVVDAYCNNSSSRSGYVFNGAPCDSTMAPDTFVIEASWPDAAGDGTDTITQVYRVHPGE